MQDDLFTSRVFFRGEKIMAMNKSILIEFEGRHQPIDDLICRARFHAQANRAYSLEVILHLLDHAYQFGDSDLIKVCRDIMQTVNSPSPYSACPDSQHADSQSNRPKNEKHEPTEMSYDNSLDSIFDERVNVHAVKKSLDQLTFRKTGRVYWFVVYKVLLHLKWLKEDCQQKTFLEWVNLQYHCGWTQKHHFTFSRDVDKTMRTTDVSLWNTIDNAKYTKGESYYQFAVLLRNTFEMVIMNGLELKEPVKDLASGKNRDRSEFMKKPGQFINWGK